MALLCHGHFVLPPPPFLTLFCWVGVIQAIPMFLRFSQCFEYRLKGAILTNSKHVMQPSLPWAWKVHSQ